MESGLILKGSGTGALFRNGENDPLPVVLIPMGVSLERTRNALTRTVSPALMAGRESERGKSKIGLSFCRDKGLICADKGFAGKTNISTRLKQEIKPVGKYKKE